MLEPTIDSPDLLEEIQALLDAKRAGQELDIGPRIDPIDSFIEAELRRHEAAGGFRKGRAARTVEKLDALLTQTVEAAWS